MKKISISGKHLIILCILGIAMMISIGCTSDEPAGVEVTETKVTAEFTPTASGEAVHYTVLMPFLPTSTSNWDAGEPTGAQASYDEGSWSWASNEYVNKDGIAMVDIVIQDTAGAMVGYQTIMDTYFEIDTPELKMEKETVQGYPGWVVTDKMDDTFTQLVDINDRFIIWTQVTGGKKDYITLFNSMMDLDGIAALG